MNEIMVKVNELFDMLVVKNKDADASAVIQTNTAKEQEATATAQAEKDTELKGREAKVVKVENILEIKQKNQETLNKIIQTREKLAEATSAHNMQVAKDKQELLELDKDVKSNLAALKEKQAKFDKEQVEFEEKKKKIKEIAIAEIIDRK